MNNIELLLHEAQAAEDRYGGFASTHEGYGVLAEEMMELLGAIHDNRWDEIRTESLQVAAVALRLANMTGESFMKRSGITEGQ